VNELHLFAGAGGGILAGKMLGHRCVCAVEWEPYCQAVLVARQNDGSLPPFPIWDDVQTFDGRPWRGVVDIVAGGFPCQDISVAGKGAGITGERSGMWTHMARIIGEVRPRYVFVENSPALLTRGLGVVLGDLARIGYDCRWTVLGADEVGAPHQRDRFWLVGSDSNNDGSHREKRDATVKGSDWEKDRILIRDGFEVADTTKLQCNGSEHHAVGRRESGRSVSESGNSCGYENLGHSESSGQQTCVMGSWKVESRGTSSWNSWWSSEPDLGRVANGVAYRLDRLKAIGNGQVPHCAVAAWKMLIK
jgi:DNA (cytosine-5)-methyltransferase 1